MSHPEILIVAGEASGDHYGAELVECLNELDPEIRFYGMGGERMAGAGVDLLHHIKDVTVMGFHEVLTRIRPLFRSFRDLVEVARTRRPQACIYIDFPDYNLRLARKIKEASGTTNIYYIGPTVWAWRPGRVHSVREAIDRMLVIFPFEEPLYRAAAVDVEFVGHPLVGTVRPKRTRQELFELIGAPKDRPLVGLLPGSRHREIELILPRLRDAAALIAARVPASFAVGLAESVDRRQVEATLGPASPIHIVEHATYDLMKHADLLLTACGTAPLEASLLSTPQVVVYATSRLTFGIASRMVDVPHICIVNLILGERALPELVQESFTPGRVADEALSLLEDPAARDRQLAACGLLQKSLGHPGAARRAARAVLAAAGLRGAATGGTR